MIKAKLIIKKVKIKKLLKIILSKVIHLGKNPIKGGNPPKDNKGILINIFCILVLNFKLNIWLILNNLKLLNIKIIEKERKI